jgi:hypothetical protein
VQAVLVGDAEQQRSDLPRRPSGADAADHDLLHGRQLDLEPLLGSGSATVGRPRILDDHTLQVQLRGGRQRIGDVVRDRRHGDGGDGVGRDRLEDLAAFAQGTPGDVSSPTRSTSKRK